MIENHQQNEAAIVALLDQPADKTIDAMVEKLSKRRGVAAVLFYGNRLREVEADGLLDFYVLIDGNRACLLYTSPSPRDLSTSRMPSSA